MVLKFSSYIWQVHISIYLYLYIYIITCIHKQVIRTHRNCEPLKPAISYVHKLTLINGNILCLVVSDMEWLSVSFMADFLFVLIESMYSIFARVFCLQILWSTIDSWCRPLISIFVCMVNHDFPRVRNYCKCILLGRYLFVFAEILWNVIL